MAELQIVGSDSEVSIVPVTDVGSGDPNKATSFRPAFGPNTSTQNGQYSFYYLAGADITVPSIGPNDGVTAKVRRIFEKKFDVPFSYALFYVDDLEAFPTSDLTITGPIQTNGNLYIGTSHFIAAAATTAFPTAGTVGFGTSYVNGPSPNDPTHSIGLTPPVFPDRQPPSMQAPYLPFGWNPNLDVSGGATVNNTNGFHELIERPLASATDPIQTVRFFTQADYGVLITPGPGGPNDETLSVYQQSATPNGTPTPLTNGSTYNAIVATVTTSKQQNQTIQDNREGAAVAGSVAGQVRLTTIDVGALSKNVNKGNTTNPIGMIYVSDTMAGAADSVVAVAPTAGGSGYLTTTPPIVTFSAPATTGGVTATGTPVVSNGAVTGITITNGGSGYTAPPVITLTGSSGTGAIATAILGTKPDSVTFGQVTAGGSGYAAAPTVTFATPPTGGVGATGTTVVISGSVVAITITNPGSGYTAPPTVTFSSTNGGTGAAVTTILGLKRGIRILGPYINPVTGISVVSENPVYIQGDYNTGMTGTTAPGVPPTPTATPPSDGGAGSTSTASPVVGTYWRPSAVVADAITLLSNNWSDPYANYSNPSFTDGVSNSTTTYKSATASFSSTDVGASITGTNIPAGTTIASVTNPTTVVLSAATTASGTGLSFKIADGVSNATTTYKSARAAFAPTDVGASITGTNIPAGTTIASVTNATTILLSAPTTGSGSGLSFTINKRFTASFGVAKNTTVNAALVTGIVPSNGTNYSGGAENFVRLLEDWSSARFTYYGSMVQLWQSKQATAPWTSSANVYKSPTAYNWFYDIHFEGDPNNPSGNANPNPPGNFQLAAYLQQQRWYQVY